MLGTILAQGRNRIANSPPALLLCAFGTRETLGFTDVTFLTREIFFHYIRNETALLIVLCVNPRYDSGRTHPYHPIMRPLIYLSSADS
jgi:hypothetical protein